MIDPQAPLDQPGATIDKFATPRNPLALSDEFYDYLRAEGVEDDLALKLARAFERREQQREFEFSRFLDEVERWMNLHRHPEIPSLPYPPPQFDMWLAVGGSEAPHLHAVVDTEIMP